MLIIRRTHVTLIEISLDEIYPASYRCDAGIESKGFLEPTTITNFPIRDHKLLLHIRRHRWLNRKDGMRLCRPLSLVAEGTNYSKEFAAFYLVQQCRLC
ncbi:ISAon1 family transposase N-terminal region protein [Bacteroides zoogleoformans]